MKAKREPLALVVHVDEPADARAFLRLYVGALLNEVRREPVEEIVEEVHEHETPDIAPERRFGLLAYL